MERTVNVKYSRQKSVDLFSKYIYKDSSVSSSRPQMDTTRHTDFAKSHSGFTGCLKDLHVSQMC